MIVLIWLRFLSYKTIAISTIFNFFDTGIVEIYDLLKDSIDGNDNCILCSYRKEYNSVKHVTISFEFYFYNLILFAFNILLNIISRL